MLSMFVVGALSSPALGVLYLWSEVQVLSLSIAAT